MDILFSICSIAVILMLYAPVTRASHSALSLLCIALLVPPVADLPTSPVNLALSLTFGVSVLAVGWAVVLRGSGPQRDRAVRSVLLGVFVSTLSDPLLCDLGTPVKASGSARAAGPGTGVAYNSLSADSPEGVEEDVEMVEFTQHSDNTESCVHDNVPYGGDVTGFACDNALVRGVWLVPAIGLAVGITGLLCFALQTRANYYILHSLWHVFMMIAAYLLVKGRLELYVT